MTIPKYPMEKPGSMVEVREVMKVLAVACSNRGYVVVLTTGELNRESGDDRMVGIPEQDAAILRKLIGAGLVIVVPAFRVMRSGPVVTSAAPVVISEHGWELLRQWEDLMGPAA
ncbi:hypothetical protein GCM10022243_65370 [Saccharothrix violaceirubra]